MTYEELQKLYHEELKEIDTEGMSVSLIEPEVIKFQETPKFIGGELYRKIYSNLDVSKSANSKLFKTDPLLWRQFINKVQSDNVEKFSISNQKYLIMQENAFSIAQEETKSRLISLIDSLENYECRIIGGSLSHIIHVYCKDCVYETESFKMYPHAIIKIDTVHGIFKYDMSYEVKTNKTSYIIGLEMNKRKSDLATLLSCSLENEFLFASKMAQRNSEYIELVLNHSGKISVRELISIVKNLGAKFSVDSDGEILDIPQLYDSSKVVKMLQSFNIPFKSLNKMSYLRKSLKKNSLNSIDLLEIISENLMNPYVIDPGKTVSEFCSSIQSYNLDEDIVKDEL